MPATEHWHYRRLRMARLIALPPKPVFIPGAACWLKEREELPAIPGALVPLPPNWKTVELAAVVGRLLACPN